MVKLTTSSKRPPFSSKVLNRMILSRLIKCANISHISITFQYSILLNDTDFYLFHVDSIKILKCSTFVYMCDAHFSVFYPSFSMTVM